MNNRVTCKIILRKESKKEESTSSVNLQVFVNGGRSVIPLGIHVHEKFFDTINQTIKPKCDSSAQFNSVIAQAKSRVSEIQLMANNRNNWLDRDQFRVLFEEQCSVGCFIDYMEKTIKKRTSDTDITKDTAKAHLSVAHNLRKFKNVIQFYEISNELVENFRLWHKKKENGINTTASNLTVIRTYMNIALEYGYMFHYPFDKVKIQRGKTSRNYLEEDSLIKLLNLYDSNKLETPLKTTLMYFLLGCFTSLRCKDVRAVNADWVFNGSKLVLKPNKTIYYNKTIEIHLSNVAKRILSDVLNYTGIVKKEQCMNRDLKVLGAMAGLEKAISFHTGRHTFATIFLRLGGKVEVLQQILGHESILTTMIYVHIVNKDKANQIDNFNSVFQ